MSIEYRFHGSEHCLMCTASGEIHLDEILDYVDRVIDDQSVVGEFFEIVDFTQVKDFDFGYYSSRELMAKLAQLSERKGYLGSCLVSEKEDLVRGMTNIFRVMGESTGVEVLVFDSIASARKHVDEYFDRSEAPLR